MYSRKGDKQVSKVHDKIRSDLVVARELFESGRLSIERMRGICNTLNEIVDVLMETKEDRKLLNLTLDLRNDMLFVVLKHDLNESKWGLV